ncbi:MAG: tetratricopeptide repeat protein [Kofleriaceae bacterium]
MTRPLATALATVLATVIAIGGGHADVWKRAIQGSQDPAKELYDDAMREGDEAVLLANTQSASLKQIKTSVTAAIAAYRKAAAARPKLGEPHYRIATTLHSFYLENCASPQHQFLGVTSSPLRDCDNPQAMNVAVAKETIAAWNAFEAREPLDPRLGVGEGSSILFERAILHTKLGTKADWEAAVQDYLRYLDRIGDPQSEEAAVAWGNLAETYMMLGKMNESIDAYREAVRHASDASTFYGYAVALDRDERIQQAHALVLKQGRESYLHFSDRVSSGTTFFVPEGEEEYYYALIEEAWGNVAQSITHWRRFIRSGAHPQFHPRAKHHLDSLLAKQRTRPTPPPPPDPYDF